MLETVPHSRRPREDTAEEERMSKELLRKADMEKEEIVQEWKNLCRFLEEQKQQLIQFLESLAGNILERRGQCPSTETHTPSETVGSQECIGYRQAVGSSFGRTENAFPARQGSILEVELRLCRFSERRKTILGKVLNCFRESLKMELESLMDPPFLLESRLKYSRTYPLSTLGAFLQKQREMQTDAGSVVQNLLEFEDVAVDFTDGEWDLLNANQKALYKDVMRENYENSTALVLAITKPSVISRLEQMDNPLPVDLHRDLMGGVAERMRENEVKGLQAEKNELGCPHVTFLQSAEPKSKSRENQEAPETQPMPLGIHLGENLLEPVPFVRPDKNTANIRAGQKGQEVCSVCWKTFNNKASLVRHRRIHSEEKSHTCTECGKSFNKRSNLITHQRTHTGEKPYRCGECWKNFSLSSSLVRHQRIHTGEKPYRCSMCERSFNQKPSLVVHERTHHREKPYKCSACEKSYSHATSLTAHEKIHREEKPYRCAECAKRFSFSSQLITHQRIHMEQKPYKCSTCERGFSRPSSLVVHERTHTGEKPYKCPACEKGFPSNWSLVRHQLSHAEEKQCAECGKSFSPASQQQRIQAGEEATKCPGCENRFALNLGGFPVTQLPKRGKLIGTRSSSRRDDIRIVDSAAVQLVGDAFGQSSLPLHYHIHYAGWE